MIKKEMIAMLLAGGQGSRLGVLTQKVAKPGHGRRSDPVSAAAAECTYWNRYSVGSGPQRRWCDGTSAV